MKYYPNSFEHSVRIMIWSSFQLCVKIIITDYKFKDMKYYRYHFAQIIVVPDRVSRQIWFHAPPKVSTSELLVIVATEDHENESAGGTNIELIFKSSEVPVWSEEFP